MKKYISILLKHWQTTSLGILIGVITSMYARGIITTQDWIIAIGGVGTIAGMIMKDPDKTQSK
jgi:ABC-type transport system involved in cytochrome bd biosynthesis fused ATPase/permease subunit